MHESKQGSKGWDEGMIHKGIAGRRESTCEGHKLESPWHVWEPGKKHIRKYKEGKERPFWEVRIAFYHDQLLLDKKANTSRNARVLAAQSPWDPGSLLSTLEASSSQGLGCP